MQTLAGALALGLLAMPARAGDFAIDPARSDARFQLRLPFGRVLDGRFARIEAEWLPQPDGRWRVRVRLPAAAAEIPARPRYARIMRSEAFFDSQRHPQIDFLSDPFDAVLLGRGGRLAGVLTMRGIDRRQSLQLLPSTCLPQAARPCTVEVRGEISRGGYGITALGGVIDDAVRIRLRIANGGDA